jgi:hypothetical protein
MENIPLNDLMMVHEIHVVTPSHNFPVWGNSHLSDELPPKPKISSTKLLQSAKRYERHTRVPHWTHKAKKMKFSYNNRAM